MGFVLRLFFNKMLLCFCYRNLVVGMKREFVFLMSELFFSVGVVIDVVVYVVVMFLVICLFFWKDDTKVDSDER